MPDDTLTENTTMNDEQKIVDTEAVKALAKEKATSWWIGMGLDAKVNAALLLAILVVIIFK